LARPSFGLMPASSRVAPCSANSAGKNASTACPKMIGSDTFIIVALRCRENRTPLAFASAICSVRNASSARLLMTVASMTSPSSTGVVAFSTVTVPSSAMCSMRTPPAASTVVERSFDRKSPLPIVATWVVESGDQAPIEWGWARA
jgi:hypothetical protein